MKRILIVDDHEVVRDGVKRIFDKQPGETTFGEASTPQQAVELARRQKWDVVVLDLSLGGRSGLDVLKELKQTWPKLPSPCRLSESKSARVAQHVGSTRLWSPQ